MAKQKESFPYTRCMQDEPLEKQCWTNADKLRKNFGEAGYKRIVPGPIFLKCIPDAFAERSIALKTELGGTFARSGAAQQDYCGQLGYNKNLAYGTGQYL